MVRKSALSLIISLLFFCLNTRAASFYTGLNYTFAGVVSEDDIYNGAYHWDPGIILGVQFGRLTLDSQIKQLHMKKDYEKDGAQFVIEVDSLFLSSGIRLEVMPFITFNLGVNYQNVDSRYRSINSNKFINGLPDNHYISYYIGGGFAGEVFPNILGRVDINYYRGDQKYGLLTLELALAYKLITF